MGYVDPDLVDDEGAVAEGVLASLADQITGWQPAEGHVETNLAEAVGVALATAIAEVKAQAAAAYTGFGQDILNIVLTPAGVAQAMSTWTITTTLGLRIPGGTQVIATTPDGSSVTFVVAEDVTIPAGVTTQPDVPLIALEPGSEFNGAIGPAICDELVDVDTVTITTAADGGSEEEDADEFRGKVRDRAQRMHAMPLTPDDYAAFALDVPGIARAFVINRLDPAAPGVDSPGHTTVFSFDAAGLPIGASIKDELITYYGTFEKPLNVTVHIEDAADVELTIAITVTAQPDADKAALETAITANVLAGLDGSVWAADADRPGGFLKAPPTSLGDYQVAALIDDLGGLAAITDITINAGRMVALPAPLSMPRLDPANLTVTVN